MSAGGSLAEAAAFLGIDHRYLKASPGSAAFADDPAPFRLAVHALARQLSATPHLTNYKHRRDALQDWCIDTATWQGIISQLPPTKGPFQPELSDCKRQFASEAVWARITQGEHLLGSRIIENQLSAGDPTWRRRRDNMWHFYNGEDVGSATCLSVPMSVAACRVVGAPHQGAGKAMVTRTGVPP